MCKCFSVQKLLCVKVFLCKAFLRKEVRRAGKSSWSVDTRWAVKMSWEWGEMNWAEVRRGGKSWEELGRGGQRWESLRRVEKRWEKVNRVELRWEETKKLESCWEEWWEELRRAAVVWAEKWWPQLKRGDARWGRIHRTELKRCEASSCSSYRLFLPSVLWCNISCCWKLPPPASCGFYLYTMSRCMFTILLGIVVAALALSEIYVSHMDPPLVQHDKPCRLPSSARFSNFGAKSKEFYFGDFGRQASQATYRVHVERIQTSQP
jgi:hypothetical protein